MVNWIRIQVALALPPSYAQIRALAACVLQAGGDATPLGRRWLDAFFKRNPTCKTMPSRRMDTARLNGATVEVIQPWFRYLAVPEIHGIHQIDRYNMDETGIMEGLGSNGLVVGIAEMRTALKKDDGRRNWTTIIECISATGRHLPPLVIWKGVNVQQQWFPTEGLEGFKEWLFITSPKGWTSHAISLDWLTKIFIPRTKTVGNRPRLLIVDGYSSHCTEEFMV